MFAEPDPAPGYKHLLVYGDEAGTIGHGFGGLGTLWMPWERRGDFVRIVHAAREAHAYHGSLAAPTAPAALLMALVDETFRRRWLAFRCLITPVSDDDAHARRALVALVSRRARALPKPELKVRLSHATRRARAAGARLQAGISAALAEALPPDQALSVRAARTVDGVELAELLTGLVVSGWERKFASKERRQLAEKVAENLGWGDLAADTQAAEWKFNIAFVKDLATADEGAKTQRAVQLLLPMVD